MTAQMPEKLLTGLALKDL